MYIERLELALTKRYGMQKRAFLSGLWDNAGKSFKQVGYGLGDTFRGIGNAWDNTWDGVGDKFNSWGNSIKAGWNDFAGNEDWAAYDRQRAEQQSQAASKKWDRAGQNVLSAGKGLGSAYVNGLKTAFNAFTLPGLVYSGYESWRDKNQQAARQRMSANKPTPAKQLPAAKTGPTSQPASTLSNPFPNENARPIGINDIPFNPSNQSNPLTSIQVGQEAPKVPSLTTMPDLSQYKLQLPQPAKPAQPAQPAQPASSSQPAQQQVRKPDRQYSAPQPGTARRPSRMAWTRPDGTTAYRVNGQEVDQAAYEAAGQTRRQNGFFASSDPVTPVAKPAQTAPSTNSQQGGYNWGNLNPKQRQQHQHNLRVSGYSHLPGGTTVFRTAGHDGQPKVRYVPSSDFAAMRRGSYTQGQYGRY